MPGAYLYAFEDPDWVRVIAGAGGRLSVDVITATTTNVNCYGYDGANWRPLTVESAASHNIRTRLYGGANAVLVGQSSAALAYTNYGLETFAILYGDDGTNISRVGMLLAGADAVVNTLNTLGVASTLYGFNGADWDRLRVGTPADAFVTPTMALQVMSFLMGYDGADWNMVRVDAAGQLQTSEQFGGNVYSKTMTMADDNATRFEAAAKLLRDIVIIVKTHPMLLGETGVEVYPVGVNEAVGFTKVDISTLYFKNANAGDNGVITILGTEE